MKPVKPIEKMQHNVARNNLLDRVFQFIAILALMGLAYQDLLKHFISAVAPMNFLLAAAILVLISFAAISPLFRK